MTSILHRLLSRLDWEVWAEEGRYIVGVWTGPDGDLMSVRPCRTNGGAEYWLAPGATTLLGAIVRSLVLRFTGLRILEWTTDPCPAAEQRKHWPHPPPDWRSRIHSRRWLYTAAGSGAPRKSTWWMPKHVRRFIRAHNEDGIKCSRTSDLLLEGWSAEFIAEHLDIDLGTVKKIREEFFLDGILTVAQRYTMSESEREAQRRNFAYGNAKLSNPHVTRAMVDEAAEKWRR